MDPQENSPLLDKARGCLYGGAIGGAMRSPVESKPLSPGERGRTQVLCREKLRASDAN